MRRISLVIASSAAAVALLTGCGAVQDAAETVQGANQALNTAQTCLQALGAMDFSISSDPEVALQQSQEAANELSDLAAQTADTTVSQAISDLATTMANVTLADLATPVDWMADKVSQANAVLSSCAGG